MALSATWHGSAGPATHKHAAPKREAANVEVHRLEAARMALSL
jgi:hypothetical protein